MLLSQHLASSKRFSARFCSFWRHEDESCVRVSLWSYTVHSYVSCGCRYVFHNIPQTQFTVETSTVPCSRWKMEKVWSGKKTLHFENIAGDTRRLVYGLLTLHANKHTCSPFQLFTRFDWMAGNESTQPQRKAAEMKRWKSFVIHHHHVCMLFAINSKTQFKFRIVGMYVVRCTCSLFTGCDKQQQHTWLYCTSRD